MKILKTFTISLLSILVPHLAFAHAHLIEAHPADKGIIHEAPSQVVLKFSEELEFSMCKIEVKDLATGKIVSSNKIEAVGESHDAIEVKLNPISEDKGKFQVSWKVVAKDSHKMKGTYEFTLDKKVQ